jgi:hypothetical protein
LTLLNNYTQALLKREQIYQAQAKDDLERHSELIGAANHQRHQAIELTQTAIAFIGLNCTEKLTAFPADLRLSFAPCQTPVFSSLPIDSAAPQLKKGITRPVGI